MKNFFLLAAFLFAAFNTQAQDLTPEMMTLANNWKAALERGDAKGARQVIGWPQMPEPPSPASRLGVRGACRLAGDLALVDLVGPGREHDGVAGLRGLDRREQPRHVRDRDLAGLRRSTRERESDDAEQ